MSSGFLKSVAGVMLCAGIVGCKSSNPMPNAADPKAQQPGMEWRAELTPEMKAVLDELGTMGGKPIESLTPAEARKQPTPADAVMSLMKKKGMDTTPEAVGKVDEMTVPGPGGQIPIRVYTPKAKGPFPVIVYIHGGGWVIATNDTYDSSPRALCNAATAVVVSVEYRKAPEAKYPAAHDDCFAVYKWVLAHAADINGTADHVDVAGESAGGNMTIETALRAREANVALPKHLLAVYPVSQLGGSTPSIEKYASAKPLNKPMLAWFGKHYTRTPADMTDPMLAPLSADLKGLPPTTIITAQIDPLMGEGSMLADKLKAAGVSVRYKNFDGVTHEFFGMGAVVPEGKKAVAFGADGLK